MVDVGDFDPEELGKELEQQDIGSLPKSEPTEDFAEAVLKLIFVLAPDAVLQSLLAHELDQQKTLINQELYEAALIRQATFMEMILKESLKTELQEYKGEELSNNDEKIVEELSYSSQIKLGYILGVFDEEEKQLLEQFFSDRSKVAHKYWGFFSEDEREQFERLVSEIHGILVSEIEEVDED